MFDHHLLQQHNYGLINPLQVEASLWQDVPHMPLVPRELAEQADQMPLLVAFDAMEAEARISLLDYIIAQQRSSKRPYFSALIDSILPLATLQHRLTERLILFGPQGKAFFRYYDPRVFRHLHWVLRPIQLDYLLKGITQWSWCNAKGQWQSLAGPEKCPMNILRLTPEQWLHLGGLGLLNQCLAGLNMVPTFDENNTQQVIQANEWLHAAKAQLSDPEDSCLYVEQRFRYGELLHQHPAMQERLEQAQAGQSYIQLCQPLDETTLQQFVTDMHQQRQRMMS